MDKTDGTPASLTEAIRYFSDHDTCQAFLVALRWPNGITCPRCGAGDPLYLANQRRWKCRSKHARQQFSVKVKTIFEDSPLGLDKWLPAVWMIVNDKNGISSYEVGRALGITQKSAWFMLHRVRLAMQRGSLGKFSGEVEVDETFIGGKARNMHAWKRRVVVKGSGPFGSGKAAVVGVLERSAEKGKSKVQLTVIDNIRTGTLDRHVRDRVERGADIYTDALASYRKLGDEYSHRTVDHAVQYAEGKVHTNGLENFWSLLKRCLKGTYVSVEPFHLFRYLDEEAFRFNERKDPRGDAGRFVQVLATIVGRRLTYKALTGKLGPQLATTPA